jgi:hypothetical protein
MTMDLTGVPAVHRWLWLRYAYELACCYFLNLAARAAIQAERNAVFKERWWLCAPSRRTKTTGWLGVREDLDLKRKEVSAMGWWRTGSDGVIGDEPADIIDESGGSWSTPAEMPDDVRERIVRCYQRVWGREPTEEEVRDLVAFCR